jgi:hypothetical protein
MKTRLWIFVTVLSGLWMAASPARATTMISLSLEQLTQASSDIVQASVINQQSGWNSSHTQILTITTVAVSQVLKGNASSTLEIQQLGGTVGNMRVFVPGDLTFQPQGEYILFLEPVPESPRYRVVGMTQGAYRIYQDDGTRQDRVILPPYSQLQSEIRSIVAANPAGTVPLQGFHKYVINVVNARIQVPRGLALSVAITSTESRGVGRLDVYGKTTTDLFPNKNLVIPAGTEVAGNAVLSNAMWTIHWDELNVRGVHAPISAISEESAGSLRGRSLVLNVR